MKQLVFLLLCTIFGHQLAVAHQASVTYVANEGVLITHAEQKVLFDPFFHQVFGTYQLVPDDIKQAIFNGLAPYDNLSAIVISHAHGDHFDADEVIKYLKKYPRTQLIAPQQAVNQLIDLVKDEAILGQVSSIKLAFNQAPKTLEVAGLMIEAVRIPHAGWPARAEVENLVFRVTLKNPSSAVTVMHLGDADPDIEHYLPFQAHWQKRVSDTALPPYWFFFSAEGRDILSSMLNVKKSIGIHVPMEVPNQLRSSGMDYFSKPGETRKIVGSHQH